MTPLAYRIVRELTLPKKRRSFADLCGILPRMADIHCFEVSQVLPLAGDMVEKLAVQGRSAIHALGVDEIDLGAFHWFGSNDIIAFLPAPKTWIEWRTQGVWPLSKGMPTGGPVDDPLATGYNGFLLEQENDIAHCIFCSDVNSHHHLDAFGATIEWRFPLSGNSSFGIVPTIPINTGIMDRLSIPREAVQRFVFARTLRLYALLALINSPRVIERKQHVAHAGMAKRLLQMQKSIGHFPLHAWTEIKLECQPPHSLVDEPEYEAHLTGRKCLHFCRAHLRMRAGQVEFVRAHWRGDASLGIKRSRYRVTPERTQ